MTKLTGRRVTAWIQRATSPPLRLNLLLCGEVRDGMTTDTTERPLSQRWNPYLRYTVNESDLREWYNVNGARAFYDGRLWKPVYQRLFGVRNAIIEVWFVESAA